MGLLRKKKTASRRTGRPTEPQRARTAQSRTPAQPAQQAAARQPDRKKRRRRRHKSNRTLYYILVLLIAAIVGTVLSLTVFFKIQTITVKGVSKYPVEAIRQLTGISIGDNLFRADLKAAEEKIGALPYVEEVHLSRAYPPEIVVEVTQARPVAALLESGGGYTLISADGRILERGAQPPDGVLRITGATLGGSAGDYPAVAPKKATEEEKTLAEDAAEVLRMTNYTLAALEESGLALAEVDFSDRYNICASYDESITIEFGSESELSRKMKLVAEVIENQLEPDFRGVLYAGTVGKVWADPESSLPEISIPDDYVYDEATGTYVDPAELNSRQSAQESSEPEENEEE